MFIYKTIIIFTTEFEKEMDRHRKGYYAEYAKRTGRKDRHRQGYYREYNAAHPERLERGYTKGYVNGNVSEGKIGAQPKQRTWYDKMFNPTLTDLIEWKCDVEWHDDDWCESYQDEYGD